MIHGFMLARGSKHGLWGQNGSERLQFFFIQAPIGKARRGHAPRLQHFDVRFGDFG